MNVWMVHRQTRHVTDIIGVNRPAFGGTVLHFHQMSRVPRNETDVPHFCLNGGYYFFALPIILHF